MSILQEREQKGIEIGREIGKEIGRELAKIAMVKNAIEAGIEMDIIVRVFKLSRERVEEISKEDYLKLEAEIFKDMSLDEIYDNAKNHWGNLE